MSKDYSLESNYMKYITLAILLIVFLFGIKSITGTKKETIVTQSNNVSTQTTQTSTTTQNCNE